MHRFIKSRLPQTSRSQLPCWAIEKRIACIVLSDKCALGQRVTEVPANLPVLRDCTSQHILLAGGFSEHQRTVDVFHLKGFLLLCKLCALPEEWPVQSRAGWGRRVRVH